MGSVESWLISFEASAKPSKDVVTRAMASIPLVKLDVREKETWLVRVGRGEFGFGFSNAEHVLDESQERGMDAEDKYLASLLERADVRYELWFDERDRHWFDRALEVAVLRLAALTNGVVFTYYGDMFGAIASRPTTLKGVRFAALRKAAETLFPGFAVKLFDVRQPFFARWSIVDATASIETSTQRVFLAVDDEARVVVLTGAPDAVAALCAHERPATLEAENAARLYALNVPFWTSPPGLPRRVVTSFDDIPFGTNVDDATRAFIDIARRDHAASIGPLGAERAGTGWRVTSWHVDDDCLFRQEVDVAADGEIVTRDVPVCAGLPIDRFHFGGMVIV